MNRKRGVLLFIMSLEDIIVRNPKKHSGPEGVKRIRVRAETNELISMHDCKIDAQARVVSFSLLSADGRQKDLGDAMPCFALNFVRSWNFSKKLYSSSMSAVRLGITVFNHCSAHMNCYRCSPFVKSSILWTPSIPYWSKYGSNVTAYSKRNLPH